MIKYLLSSIVIISFLTLQSKAEDFSTTNVQYLYGNSFDKISGDRIDDGVMDTITLEHFGTWEYGSNFFFVDLTSANFNSNKSHKVYAEYAPNISLSKLSGNELSFGIIKDIHISAQINQGDNYRVLMAGAGVSMSMPGFDVFKLDIYSRKDNFNKQTFQSTLVYKSTFFLATRWTLEGFLDYSGVDNGKVLITQPRILADASFINPKYENLQAGVEFYIYGNYGASNDFTEIIPQLMVKWTW